MRTDMAGVQVQVEYSTDELQKFLQMASAAVALAMKYTATEVWGNVRKMAPVDQGRLAGSFNLAQGGPLDWNVYSNVTYALDVHQGTGIYGPEGKEIKPVTAKALKFYWPKTGKMMIFKGDLQGPREKASFAAWATERGMTPVFAWVQGTRPRPYADWAIKAASERTDEFIRKAIKDSGG